MRDANVPACQGWRRAHRPVDCKRLERSARASWTVFKEGLQIISQPQRWSLPLVRYVDSSIAVTIQLQIREAFSDDGRQRSGDAWYFRERPFDRRLASETFPHRNTKGVHVGKSSRAAAWPVNLRGRVARGSGVARSNRSSDGQSEVAQFRSLEPILSRVDEEDIARLDIAVQETEDVHLVEGPGDRLEHLRPKMRVSAQVCGAASRRRAPALEPFGDEIPSVPLGQTGTMNCDNVRVLRHAG